MQIDTREVCRYLGVRDARPDAALAALIDRSIKRVSEAATPRFVSRTMPLTVGEHSVKVGDRMFDSVELARHLEGCDEVVLFAATLGSSVDRLLQRDMLLVPSLSVTEQAAAAAYMEAYADTCCQDFAKSYGAQKRFLRPRFSPGYGDLSLAAQPVLLQLLCADKRIGLGVTASHMLTPMKSITALIGVSDHVRACYTGGCAMCGKRDCAFRREENV